MFRSFAWGRGDSSSLALAALAIAACGGRTGLSLSGVEGGTSSAGAATTGGASAGSPSSGTTGAVGTGSVSGAAAGTSSGSSTGAASGASSGISVGAPPCGAAASALPVSFANQIMPILQGSCSAEVGMGPGLCHGAASVTMFGAPGGARPWFGPPLPVVNSAATLTMIYDGFVCPAQGACTPETSSEDPSMDIVQPGDPMHSFLWYKITGTQGSLDSENPDACARGDLGTCGLPMPYSLTGFTLANLLPTKELDLVCGWITQGAKLSLCPAGQGSQNGICAPCSAGETLCGDLCVDEQTDANHCGTCGAVCPTGGICQEGACVCHSGAAACGGACVDEQTDSTNCGACGSFCPVAATCEGGACVCPSGETQCGAYCDDLQTDLANCGACGAVCPPASTCAGGMCICPSGEAWCGAYCVDERIDSANCGACGAECPVSAPTCLNAQCTCLTGTSCGGVCVDEQVDANNCGQCGVACAPGRVCLGGVCGNPPSCVPGGPGMTNCGSGGQGTESCCSSLEVAGGTTYARTYDSNADGSASLLSDPATVSSFRLDEYLVTVGRFRQFMNAWNGGAGFLPPAGSGKHAHLNGGLGLLDVGASAGGQMVYEPGWAAADDGNVEPTDANLSSCAPYSTWTSTPGSQENLPINCVSWAEAYAFCIWDGGFLPSEAEWEYAAAGGSQQREYPWGSTPSGTAATYLYAIYGSADPDGDGWTGCSNTPGGSCNPMGSFTDIAPVGTAARGAARWGQLDMAGDVFEWNMDYFDGYVTPCADCALLTLPTRAPERDGGAVGDRIVRGGDFGLALQFAVPPVRFDTTGRSVLIGDTGFRCARAPLTF